MGETEAVGAVVAGKPTILVGNGGASKAKVLLGATVEQNAANTIMVAAAKGHGTRERPAEMR